MLWLLVGKVLKTLSTYCTMVQSNPETLIRGTWHSQPPRGHRERSFILLHYMYNTREDLRDGRDWEVPVQAAGTGAPTGWFFKLQALKDGYG